LLRHSRELLTRWNLRHVPRTAKKGLAIVKELNAIVTKKLRKTDPVVLGVWKAASRLEQPPQCAEERVFKLSTLNPQLTSA
jgi:hypothetical protein